MVTWVMSEGDIVFVSPEFAHFTGGFETIIGAAAEWLEWNDSSVVFFVADFFLSIFFSVISSSVISSSHGAARAITYVLRKNSQASTTAVLS
jgi:hypothetical protein